jgi:hypothetical protein
MINNNNVIHWSRSSYACWTRFCVQHCFRVYGSWRMCHQSTQYNLGTLVWWCPTSKFLILWVIGSHFPIALLKQDAMKMASLNVVILDQFHKKNHTCKHYHVSCTKWTLEGAIQGSILKNTLFKSGDHLETNDGPYLNPTT